MVEGREIEPRSKGLCRQEGSEDGWNGSFIFIPCKRGGGEGGYFLGNKIISFIFVPSSTSPVQHHLRWFLLVHNAHARLRVCYQFNQQS